MKTAILYVRVATADQSAGDDNPLQTQLNNLKTFCQKQNIQVIGEYSEVASGASFERQEFKQMVDALKSGKEKADVILITKWDRFSRNLAGTLEMIKILRTIGIKVKSLQDFESNDFETLLKQVLTKKKTK